MLAAVLTLAVFAPAEAQFDPIAGLFYFYNVPSGAALRPECVGKYGASQPWGFAGSTWYEGQPLNVTSDCSAVYIYNDPNSGVTMHTRFTGKFFYQQKVVENEPRWWLPIYFETMAACENDRATNYMNKPPAYWGYATTPCKATPTWKAVRVPAPDPAEACLHVNILGSVARASWPNDAKAQWDGAYGSAVSLACTTACRQNRSQFCPNTGGGGFNWGGMFGR